MRLHTLLLAFVLLLPGCPSASPEPRTHEPPEMGTFTKLAPIDSSLHTLTLHTIRTDQKPAQTQPYVCSGGPLNFEWIAAADVVSPRVLIVVEVRHRLDDGEDIIMSHSLMVWDKSAKIGPEGRPYRGKLEIPKLPGNYIVRICEPDTIFAESPVKVVQ